MAGHQHSFMAKYWPYSPHYKTAKSAPGLALVASADAVADEGPVEGHKFCYIIERDFLKPHPLEVKTTPISDRFGERIFLLYLSIDPFLIEIFAKAC